MTIQYDGTVYHGWQIQQNAKTVQSVITNALNTLTRESINLIGAGRTDSGVHALGQAANFKTSKELDLYRFRYSLNSMLPHDIAVRKMMLVDENFHSRYDAISRTYWYIVYKEKSPFFRRYGYYYHHTIDIDYLNRCSDRILGERDFRNFAKELPGNDNANCTVVAARWRDLGDRYLFRIEANRFLHSMVRIIAGTLLRFQNDKIALEEIDTLFLPDGKLLTGPSVPPCGLFLREVKFGHYILEKKYRQT